MLRAALPGRPLQNRTVVQWDIGAVLKRDGAADESVSLQSGITPATSAAHTKGCVDVVYKKGAAVAANPFIVAVIMNGKLWPSSSYR